MRAREEFRGVSRLRVSILFLVMSVGVLADASLQDTKGPVPTPEAQKAALAVVRDIFKDEYARRDPAERTALARKLQAQGEEAQGDPASQYVLLAEARDLYVEGGELESAVAVIDLLKARFLLGSAAMKATVLSSAGRNVKTSQEMLKLSSRLIDSIYDALDEDDYETASSLAEQAVIFARKAKDAALTHAQARAREVSDLKAKWERIKKAKEALAIHPDDPAACTLVGRFECSVKGNWTVGLPLLAKGSEEATRTAAANDLAMPTAAYDQLVVADAWWNVAEPESRVAREKFRNRALLWYEKCTPQLTGLVKARAEQRVISLRIERLTQGDWIDFTDSVLFGGLGKAGQALEVAPNPGFRTWAKLAKFPREPVDGLSIHVHPSSNTFVLIPFEKETYCIWVDARTEDLRVCHQIASERWDYLAKEKLGRPDDCWVTLLIVDGSYLIYADGKELYRLKTTSPGLTSLSLEVHEGMVRFDQIKLRRRR